MPRLVLAVALIAVAGTAAGVSYAVLTLPEVGDVQRPAVPVVEWAQRNGLSAPDIAEQCGDTFGSGARGQACVTELIEQARDEWRASPAGGDDLWTTAELSSRRDSYLAVGAIILAALAVGLLAGRLLPPRRVTR